MAASKRKLAAEHEDYLIEELGKTAQDLLCKWKPTSDFYFRASIHKKTSLFGFSVGIEPYANTERHRVEGKIFAGAGSSNS